MKGIDMYTQIQQLKALKYSQRSDYSALVEHLRRLKLNSVVGVN